MRRPPRSLGELAVNLVGFTVGWLIGQWWEDRQERKEADAKAEAVMTEVFRQMREGLEEEIKGGKL